MRQTQNTYLVTCVTDQRRLRFQVHANAQTALDALLHYAKTGHYQLHAAVVMPDHIHALLTPAADHAVERCVGMIKGGISFRLRDRIRGELWQEGYDDRRIRDPEQFSTAVEYIRQNPVRRGLRDWPFVYVGGPGG